MMHGPKPPRFTVIPLRDIEPDPDPEWRIDGVLPKTGFGVIYGPPGCGKTFLAIHAALVASAAYSFFGRDVEPCAVVYIAAEAGRGIKKRIAAARRELRIPKDAPFYLITAAPNLGFKGQDLAELIKSIEAVKVRPGLIFLDTIARVTPGTDENKAHEYGVFLANAAALGAHFGALTLGVHHTGKDETKGMRGSSAGNGATDVELRVRKADGVQTVKIEKMRDGEDDLEFSFRLEVADVGNGKTTCIVHELSDVSRGGPSKPERPKISGQTRIAWDALIETLNEMGAIPPSGDHVPENVRCVKISEWKARASLRGMDEADKPESFDRAFRRAKEKLIEFRMIAVWGDHVWVV